MDKNKCYCEEYPICRCNEKGCEYNTDKQGEIKQRVADYYNSFYEGRSVNKKPKRKHATNYTPPKRRHRK